MKCAATPGAGNRRTRTATSRNRGQSPIFSTVIIDRAIHWGRNDAHLPSGRRRGRNGCLWPGRLRAGQIRSESRHLRRSAALHEQVAGAMGREAGEGLQRSPRLQVLPRRADGAGARALRPREERPGRRVVVPARRHAGALPAHRADLAAVHGRQRRDRHQDAERRRAALEVPRRRASRRARAAAPHPSAGQRAHHQEADPHRR